ncbi:MAG: hypothetical protein JEZ00_00920 [Anaerolineaceae bacterium]|nr:hypothetical protein [Anaerolineaceae bacterium]
MNQIDENDFEYGVDYEDEEPTSSRWIFRLLSLFLLLVFLVPLLIQVVQIIFRFLQPEVEPTPIFLENLLHG